MLFEVIYKSECNDGYSDHQVRDVDEEDRYQYTLICAFYEGDLIVFDK